MIKLGMYRHYKGGLYEVLGEALDCEEHTELVVYVSKSESKEFGIGSMWVRPKASFIEEVEVEGERVPRFLKL
jgi:hypothetical protein